MKIIFERDKCIGCGACSAACPEHFELGGDGKTNLLKSKLNSDGNYEKEVEKYECDDVVAGCPAQCIHIKK